MKLLFQLSRNHASEANLMKDVLQTVADLKALGLRHQPQLDWFRCRWIALRQLPPLFAEMFDIPRTEDQQQQLPPSTDNVERAWNWIISNSNSSIVLFCLFLFFSFVCVFLCLFFFCSPQIFFLQDDFQHFCTNINSYLVFIYFFIPFLFINRSRVTSLTNAQIIMFSKYLC